MSAELQQIFTDWAAIISHPKILIPLVGGIGFGLLMCKFPLVSRLRRKSDREFIVYGTDGVTAVGLFLYTQADKPLASVLLMAILVFFSSMFIPWFYFNVYRKRKQ